MSHPHPVWQAYYAAPVKTTSGPRRMIVGSHDNGAICFNDAASGTWTTLGAPAAGDAISLKVSPVNSNKAYARTEDGSCFRRTGNAQQLCADIVWTTVCPTGGVASPSYWHNNILSPHPTILNTVYFLGADHVRVSTNSGDAFTAWPLPSGHRGASIYVDGASALYVGTAGNGVVRSTNNGQSWSNWALNTSSPAVVMAILQGATTGSGDTYWMATTSGLYRKVGAGSPQVVAGGGGYVISDVAVDPACPTRVYAAYGFVPTRIQHRGGIVFSSDNGATWSSLTSGLDIHQGPVADVEVDPVDPEVLYAASYGRGYWMYDWGGSLPACQP